MVDFSQQLKDARSQHHVCRYNREKFDWEWQTVHCLGVWAFGGNKVTPSSNFLVEILVPKSSDEQVEGWYCYIGPIPEFKTDFVEADLLITDSTTHMKKPE